MLWRFLLAVVAVSCTLSRTHAHGPKDQIKDLVCVLLLSGIQKEDLDVSMLNKLQRYNVNIHDMNNEELLQECMELRNKSNREINTTLSNANGSSDGVLQENDNSPQTQSNPTHPDKEPSMQTVNTKQEINNDTIEYFDGKPKLDSVLKFWQDMNLNKETTRSSKNNNFEVNMNEKYVSEPKNKRNVKENSESNEEDDIKKLLENYFSKKQHNKNSNRSKKETRTTRRSIDAMYKQLIETRTDNNNDNFGIVRSLPNILPLYNRENDKSRMRLLPIEDTKPYYGNFTHIFGALNRLNSNNQDINRYSKDNKILPDNIYLRNYIETERLVSTTEKETQKTISSDMIKEIANSVKEIVLRDLKLNIKDTSTFRTTPTPPTTTTVTKTTSPSPVANNLKIQESVMNKFLEMFEEIKTLKKNTIQMSSSDINKQNVQQVLPRTLTLQSISGVEPPRPVYNNPYQVKYPKSQNLNFLPQVHKYRSNELQVTIKSAPKSYIPITFQTNNLEIPPLGIPIDTPLNPINQNIIVTSEIPYRIGVIKNNLRPRNNPFSELEKFEDHVPKQTHVSKSHDSNFNVPTSYDVRIQSNKAAPKHHQSYYDKIRSNNYRPRSENTEYIKTPEAPRFHERLENIDFLDVPDKKRYTDRVDCCNEKYSYSKQMVECCDRKIASRQQMSLNNMKKASYDDTHFKNFLKTQQKVTDMLERILGTRDTVRSVETT